MKKQTGVDSACIARAENRFSAAWDAIEGSGGCATTGDKDAIEARVDTYVTEVVTEVMPNCPTTTTLVLCADRLGTCDGACPGGQTCTADVNGCNCVGPQPCCESAGSHFCAVGICPAGETCQVVYNHCGPVKCACQ